MYVSIYYAHWYSVRRYHIDVVLIFVGVYGTCPCF
ncbi:hypothetical protein predicted by Glimmer/Critica [Acetobacter ghanensis]|uniref:Uncharacterized protein n=1 Tax=Acetobacter ghanensis TaxID=431306 RepID=A0A0U5BKB6_9PROT|nr:hypothetical protein predicted by Glimmer/Critica [Acetobacter ghanensis]